MSERTINTILETIKTLWSCESNLEISLEANPTSVESKKFKSFQKSGVNRLSMGVQALNDEDLRRLGRLHSAQEAKKAFSIASKYFSHVSFDLIYGRQYQTIKSWENELSDALKMSLGHLSLYQLTIEKNTRFGALQSKGKLLGLPEDQTSIDLYNLTNQLCESANLYAYEISNHAKKGEECQHNLNYWRGGAFLGIGPGAHGRVDIENKRYQTEAPSNPEVWLEQAHDFKFEKFIYKSLSTAEQAEEYIIMGLRLQEGLNMKHYVNVAKKELPDSKINDLLNENLIEVNDQILKTTNSGKLLTNYIIRELLC